MSSHEQSYFEQTLCHTINQSDMLPNSQHQNEPSSAKPIVKQDHPSRQLSSQQLVEQASQRALKRRHAADCDDGFATPPRIENPAQPIGLARYRQRKMAQKARGYKLAQMMRQKPTSLKCDAERAIEN